MAEQYWQKELETAPRAEIEALQLKRLKETVEREYAKVPIYRERMDSTGVRPEDIKTLDDIRRLPFTVKPPRERRASRSSSAIPPTIFRYGPT